MPVDARRARRRRAGHRRPRDRGRLGRRGRAAREHREGRARALPALRPRRGAQDPRGQRRARGVPRPQAARHPEHGRRCRPRRSPSSARRPHRARQRRAGDGPRRRRRAARAPQVVGVTVLTSLTAERAGGRRLRRLAARRRAPAGGARCRSRRPGAGLLAARGRRRTSRGRPRHPLITPGVRPAGGAAGDQARVATPEQALARRRRPARHRPAHHRCDRRRGGRPRPRRIAALTGDTRQPTSA